MHTYMKKELTIVLIFLSLIGSIGCSSHIDKQKFREIKSAAKAIDLAVEDTTLSYEQFEGLLKKLDDEIARTKAGVSTAEEKELLNSYEELLTTYQDSSILWEYKIGSFQYAWIPEGRVYVDAKVRTLVEKYHFPTESHVVELTNHHWESISADSIKLIWERAHEKLKKIGDSLW
jgi:hypothetical protein